MLWLAVVSFFTALGAVFLLRRRSNQHASTYPVDAPQRFHHGAIPRIGGVGVLIGWFIGITLAAVLPMFEPIRVAGRVDLSFYLKVVPVVLFVVAIGAIEDCTQKLSPRWRLVLTALASLLVIYWLNASVPQIGLPAVDVWWQSSPVFGIGLAFIGLVGLTHAFNLIDGYNGLAGLVAVLIGSSLAYVSFMVGDRELVVVSVCLVAATIGFLFFNYPRGLIFAGDGGAYFWGFVLALVCILLVQRHESVSPWYPVLLLIYPISETVFSTYRKLVRGQSPGMADALHLHQLVYRRVVSSVFNEDEARALLSRNNRTTPYLIVFTTFAILPATLFWRHTWALIACTLLFAISYIVAYALIVRFKVPRWLKKSRTADRASR